MTTAACCIDITQSTIPAAASSPTKPIQNDEAASSYLYFTPIPGTSSSIGTHDNNNNSNNELKNMHAACHNAQNEKMTTPPTVPLEVALAAAHPDASFDMEELDVVVSELGTHDELCIMNIFEREGHAFVLAPRVRKGDDWDCI